MADETSYILFQEIGRSTSGKTKQFVIVNKASNGPLGTIAWYPGWRKYVFVTSKQDHVVLDEKCLREIATFIEKETKDHKDAIRQR